MAKNTIKRIQLPNGEVYDIVGKASDWAVNDENAAGYVKNRTHYIGEGKDEENSARIVPNGVSYTGRTDEYGNPILYRDCECDFYLDIGSTYFVDVEIDGVEDAETYQFVAEDYSDAWVTIGNKSIVNPTKDNTGENICILMSKQDSTQFRMYSQGYYRPDNANLIPTVRIYSAKPAYVPLDERFIPDSILRESHNSDSEAHQDIRDLVNSIHPDRANMYLKRVGIGDWTYNEAFGLYTYTISASEHGCGKNAFVFDVAQTTENGTFASVMQDGEVDELGNVTIKLTEPMNGKVVISGILSEFEAPAFISNIVASDENNDGNVVFESYTTDPEIDFVNEHITDQNNPHNVTAEQIGAVSAEMLEGVQNDLIAHEAATNPHIITPFLIGAATSQDLTSHTSNTSNPHGVTAKQLNALHLTGAGTEFDSTKTTDDYTTGGTYYITASVARTLTAAEKYPNWFDNDYGAKLLVLQGYSTNYTHQFLFHGHSNQVAYRTGYGTTRTWTAWTSLNNPRITKGTGTPSGGQDGDIYIQYS